MEDRKIEADLAALKIRESENLKKLQERIREKEIELENSINLENLDQVGTVVECYTRMVKGEH